VLDVWYGPRTPGPRDRREGHGDLIAASSYHGYGAVPEYDLRGGPQARSGPFRRLAGQREYNGLSFSLFRRGPTQTRRDSIRTGMETRRSCLRLVSAGKFTMIQRGNDP
jgi:hypothetical protein